MILYTQPQYLAINIDDILNDKNHILASTNCDFSIIIVKLTISINMVERYF